MSCALPPDCLSHKVRDENGNTGDCPTLEAGAETADLLDCAASGADVEQDASDAASAVVAMGGTDVGAALASAALLSYRLRKSWMKALTFAAPPSKRKINAGSEGGVSPPA